MRHFEWFPGKALRLLTVCAGLGTSLAVAPAAQAVCDCATSGQAPYCTGSAVTMTSPVGTSVTVTLNKTYTCGRYANGDPWVQASGGGVGVQGTTPAWNGSAHGYEANPGHREWRLDDRANWVGITAAPDPLPKTYSTANGPVSFIKASGKSFYEANTNYGCGDGHNGCIQYAGIVTFVPAVPDSDGDSRTDDEFRPGYAGPKKAGPFRADGTFETHARSLPKLSRSTIPASGTWTFDKIRLRFQPLVVWNTNHQNAQGWVAKDATTPSVGSPGRSSYGLTMSINNTTAALRFLLDDFSYDNAVARAALINYTQLGIDIYSVLNNGGTYDPMADGGDEATIGGHMQGRKVPFVFAAHMLQDAGMRTRLTGGHDDFAEDREIYRGSDGVAYYGIPGSREWQWHCENASGQQRHPQGRADALCCTKPYRSYSEMSSGQMSYERLLVKLLGIENLWSDEAFLDYAFKFREGGRAPGHTVGRWGGTVAPSCNNQWGNRGYLVRFGEEMWTAYKMRGSSTTPPTPPTDPPPDPPPPAPTPLPAPTQLLN